MDIVALFEIIKTNPLCYFVVGLVLGYFLRGFVVRGLSAESRNKKTSRYQSKRADTSVRQATLMAELQEPSFELPDSVLKSLTPRRLSNVSLEQSGSEI